MQETRREWTEHKVPLVSIAEQEHIVSELRRVSEASAQEQMTVINWAMQYRDHYFLTAQGSLRRVFPKGKLLRVKARTTRSRHANQP